MIRNFSEWPQVALRPVTGIGLVIHGGQAIFSSSGYANFVHMLHEVGLPWPELSAALVAGLELVGGIAVLLGALTQFFSVIVALELLVRISFIFLSGHGFPEPLPGQPPLPGYETNLFYIGFLLALAIAGPGRFSIDEWRNRAQPDIQEHYGQRPEKAPRKASWI
jgi:putative oxidoreductase